MIRNNIVIGCFGLVLVMPTTHQTRESPFVKRFSLYVASAAATAYAGHLYCSKPQKFKPTIENLQPLSAVPAILLCPVPATFEAQKSSGHNSFIAYYQTAEGHYGIQTGRSACEAFDVDHMWILSSGWNASNGPCQWGNPNSEFIRRFLKRNIVHGPCITFVYNDNRRVFNFGQDTDQESLNLMCRQTPNKKLILYGLCRGATAIVGWLENYSNDNNISAIILESPAISLKAACYDFGGKHCHFPCVSSCIHGFYSFYYPHYNSQKPDILADVGHFSQHLSKEIPIFIGNLKNDTMTADETVAQLVKKLRETIESPIYYFVSSDATLTHAFLSKSVEYQRAVNAFLKKYNLPHNAQLAEQGQALLEKARKRAQGFYN